MTYSESSVLITGASQGIGRSIALGFAASTDRPLILLARSRKNLKKTAELCAAAGSGPVHICACDATREEDVRNIVLPEEIPPPGILVNNAGSFLFKPLTTTTNKEFQHQVDVNLFTTVNVVNRFLDGMKQLDRALILNICSVGALRGLADSGAYSAAKHAVLGYTRSLRDELQHTDIGVSAINLGQTHSPSWDESTMPPERLINPTDVARILIMLSELSERTLVEEIIIQPQHGRVPPM
jgi:short-subunit dehydrogenase